MYPFVKECVVHEIIATSSKMTQNMVNFCKTFNSLDRLVNWLIQQYHTSTNKSHTMLQQTSRIRSLPIIIRIYLENCLFPTIVITKAVTIQTEH
jgi:hypothetical protein